MPKRASIFRPLGSKPPGSSGIARSRDATERQKLYATARWRRLRLSHLQSNPLCVECSEQGLIVVATVVDHKEGHRGDWRDAFFDPDQLQSMCQQCHNAKSARELHGST
jgi:5-methylcytosine-specific restriction endonuclease McrA